MRIIIFSLFILLLLVPGVMAETANVWFTSAPNSGVVVFHTSITNPDILSFYTIHISVNRVEQVVTVLNTPTDTVNFNAPTADNAIISATISRVGKAGAYERNADNLASTEGKLQHFTAPGETQDNKNTMQDAFNNFPGIVATAFLLLIFSVLGDGRKEKKHTDAFTKFSDVSKRVKKFRKRR
jgi:hypothetical protein